MVDVVPELPPDIFYSPTFWDYQLLIPIYMWLILILMFVGFVLAVAMLYIWFVMRPVAGYGSVGDAATAQGSPTQVLSIWKNRSFVIECLFYYGNILAYGNPLAKMQMWFHNSEKATGVSANKPVMITRDGFDGTVDFIAEMAVCEIPVIFNNQWGFELVQKTDVEGNPILDETGKQVVIERERKDEKGEPYMLTTFSDIRKRLPLLEKLYPDGIPIPIYQQYDLSKIYRFTPQDQDSLKFGGDLVEEAKEWAREDTDEKPGFMDKYGLVIICAVIGFGSLGFLWYVLPIGK